MKRPRDGYVATPPHLAPRTAAQLKTIHEVITLVVFGAFSVWYLNEPLRWNHFAASGCLVAAVAFMFVKA